jgi:hypothetical protein
MGLRLLKKSGLRSSSAMSSVAKAIVDDELEQNGDFFSSRYWALAVPWLLHGFQFPPPSGGPILYLSF